MSQRSNAKAKLLEQLRRKGYNLPGTPHSKSIPVGYDASQPQHKSHSLVAVEKVEC